MDFVGAWSVRSLDQSPNFLAKHVVDFYSHQRFFRHVETDDRFRVERVGIVLMQSKGFGNRRGGVGIGTNSPEAMLHVAGGDIVLGDDRIQNTNNRSVYLAGHVFLTPWGTSDVAYLQARRGDNSGSTELQIRTSNGGNVIDAMRITNNGKVGIGTTNPAYKLQVNGSVAGIGPYINFSDRRYKKNIHTLSHALDKIMQLRGVDFEWKKDEYPDLKFKEGKQIGFIAQEIQEVLPEVVRKSNELGYSVAYGQVVPVLVEAIKEQQKIIEQQKAALDQQRAENAATRAELNTLKNKMSDLNAKMAELQATMEALQQQVEKRNLARRTSQ